MIGACLTAGRDLPDWVKAYLLRVAGNVAEVNGLVAPPFEFYPESEDVQTRRKKGFYDDLAVFSLIEGWRLEAHNADKKLTLQECFERYVIECEKGNAEEETIKTAYYKGRAIAANELALAEAMQPTAEANAWPKS